MGGDSPPEPEATGAAGHRLRCLEVWGGTKAADEAVSVPGLDLYVCSRPFHDDPSGGDVYLVSMCGEGKIARIVLADVAGHGSGASPPGRALRRLVRRHITTPDPTRLARELNAEFTRSEGRHFATALLATYLAASDHLVVVNAGHPPPLWYRAGRETWELLESPPPEAVERETAKRAGVPNLPLGVVEPTPYVQFAVPLERGDVVVLYTDAVIEARDRAGAPLGTRGLLELVRSWDPSCFDTLSSSIRAALDTFQDGAEREDDLTVLVMHHNAADPPRLPVGERLRVVGRMMGWGRIDSGPSDPEDTASGPAR